MKEVYSRRFPRFETAFCIVQFDITQVIPADRVQWDPKNGGSLTASFDTRAVVTAPQASIQVNSYKEYVSRLSPERQRFFAWSKPCGSASWEDIIRKMQQGVNTTKLFEIAPDGGLAESGGSFGVILALGEDELWEMAGPVDGDPNTANSKRSELAGYAASLELLLMFTNWIDFSTNRTMHTQTWIDSSGAGRHISNMLKKKRQNRKYPHDPDLISHIQWLWTQVPNISHKISWVKGHQDTKGSFKELPRNAQLNVLADELATTFARKQLSKKHPTKINPMFFQTSEVSLIVNGQRITAYPQAAIRFHITGTRLRQHLQDSRKPWQDKIWAMIDLQAIGMAYRGMSIVNRLQVSKAIHGWLPTGKQRQQMDSMATSACPCCGESNETQEHIILCQSPKIRAARYKALTRLRSTIVTTKGSSYTWIALHKCLAAWAETGKSPHKGSIFRGVPTQFHSLLSRAIQEQEAIGWNYAFRGYLSYSWLHLQHQEHPKSTAQGLRRQWLKFVIREIWKATVTLWKERNAILHSGSSSALEIKESSTDAKIRRLYAVKDEFASSDLALFDVPMVVRLTHTQRLKKMWLSLVARYHPTTTGRKEGNQPRITQFFARKARTNHDDSRLDPDTLQDPPNINGKINNSATRET